MPVRKWGSVGQRFDAFGARVGSQFTVNTGTDGASFYTGSAGVVVSLVTGLGSGGEAQDDTLIGIENLSGSQGSDSLVGDGVANVLQGWNGADVLTGGGGKDTLTGGAGNDRFVYAGTADSAVGANADVITDFSHVQADKIDLAAIDANAGVAGDQAFSFIGSAAYSGVAGQLRTSAVGGVTTIAGDVNGDGTLDFHIQLTGAAIAAALLPPRALDTIIIEKYDNMLLFRPAGSPVWEMPPVLFGSRLVPPCRGVAGPANVNGGEASSWPSSTEPPETI